MAAYLGEWRNDDHEKEGQSENAELDSPSEGARKFSNDAGGSSDREVKIEENGVNDTQEIHGMKNAVKGAHDVDRDDTKVEDSTRKKQKTSDPANEDNSHDDSEVKN
ncbi:hypothetical protein LQW54_003550 [Pestalotiopsis sp. IQ-011]